MAVARTFIPAGQLADRAQGRVVEHELDMNRLGTSPPSALAKIRQLMRWLRPSGNAVAGAPMRSVDRELEDVWPSGNRQT
ncbi:MAG: hypothetical protein IVW56_03385 [Candidatus Binataceae bacterium]|nr:hypothetical protein [Candidatus Binataceae bacterium]